MQKREKNSLPEAGRIKPGSSLAVRKSRHYDVSYSKISSDILGV